MARKELKQAGAATITNFSVVKKVVTLKAKFQPGEIITCINMLQGLNSDITVLAKTSDTKPVNLGVFTIGAVSFDKDGNCTIPLKSMIDSVNFNNICSVLGKDYLQLRFMAVIELPDNEE